jgi:fibronectin-binding autotransporter adhesin
MTTINRNFVVRQGIDVSTTANVVGAATFSNTVSVTGNTTLSNTIAVTGNATFSNTIAVTGAATLSNTLNVTGNANVGGTLGVTGAATFSNTIAVTGNATVNGSVVLGDTDTDNVAVNGSVNTNIIPIAGNTVTLGNTTQRWGEAWLGNVTVTTTASLANITTSGTTNLNGAVILGDAAADNISVTGSVNTNIVPVAGNTLSLGNTGQRWATVWANNVTATTNVDAQGITARDLTLTGNLTVSGTTTYLNTTSVDIGDAVIVLNADLGGATPPTEDAGFTVNRGSAANVSFLWDESNDRWKVGSNAIFDSTATVTGAATFSNTVSITGAANALSTFGIGGAATFSNTISVTGAANVLSTLGVGGLASLLAGADISGTANASTGINVGANVNLSTEQINVGNSTVNSTITSSLITTSNVNITSTANVTSAINVGANVNLSTEQINVGNSTVNSTITSSLITASNVNITSTANVTSALNVGANVNLNTTQLNVGNSTVNTVITSSLITAPNVNITSTANVTSTLNVGANVNLSTTQLNVGNTTVNSTITSSLITASNVNIRSTANVTSTLNVGANVNLSTTRINVGNATVNSVLTSTTFTVGSNSLISNTTGTVIPSQLVIRGGTAGASEGGQIVLGYGNNLGYSVVGQSNNTVNLDVVGGNTGSPALFRIFFQNSDGTTTAGLNVANTGRTHIGSTVEQTDSTFKVTGTANVTSSLGVGANVNLSTTQLSVGNATVNSTVTSTVVTSGSATLGGLTANATQITITGATTLSSNGGVGVAGQVLASNGATGAPYWVSPYATITDDNTTAATRYLTMSGSTSGNITSLFVASTDLTFNPSSGTLTAVVFSSSSDERTKENIQTIENAAEIVSKLRGVSFNRKNNKSKDYGVIAQEVEKVLPDIVTTDEEGWKKVSYDSIIGVLIEAIKDQQDQINNLKALINKNNP